MRAIFCFLKWLIVSARLMFPQNFALSHLDIIEDLLIVLIFALSEDGFLLGLLIENG